METWIDSIARNANLVAIFAGLVGALAAHAVASRFEVNSGVRLLIASAAFAVLFVAGQSALGRPSDQTGLRTASSDASQPKGLRAKANALLDRVPRDLSIATARQEVTSFAAGFTTPPLRRFAGIASDTTAHELAGFFAEALFELRRDSVACVSFLFGVLDSNLPPELSSQLENRHYELAGRTAKEGREPPQLPIDSVAAISLSKEMAQALRREHGRRAEQILELMSDPANAFSKPRQVCAAAIAVYSAVDAMPRSRGGKLMRYMLHRRPGERNRGSLSPDTSARERRPKSVVQR